MSITPPAWRMYPGKRATMHALDGSDAASLAPQELREAERALAALEQLLELNGERDVAPVDIFLVDPVADPTGTAPAPAAGLHAAGSPAPAADGDAIVRVVQPEAAGGEPLGWSLVRQLIPRWFGPKAAAATLVIDGIAGVVAGRIGTGPSIEAADEWVRAGLAAGRSIFLFGPRTDEGTGESTGRAEADGDRAATSFVSYLLATFGSAALRRFLAEYDPERRDHAALVAYQRPLGALEESWLSGLRERSTGAALRSFLRHLAPLVRPYRLRYLEILGYMLFELAYGLALPLASGYLVDNVLPGGDRVRLASFILVLLAIYVLDALVGMRRVYVNELVNQRVLIGLQVRAFARLQRLSHDFYTRAKVGDVMARLFNDLGIVEQAMWQVAGVGVYLALRAVLTAVVIVALNPLLGALVLVVVPLFAVCYVMLRKRLASTSFEYQNLRGEVESVAQENLSAHAVVKAFSLEERAVAAFRARLTALFRMDLRLTMLGGLFEISMSLAITLGELLVLGVGGYLVMEGELTVGTLLAFIGLLGSLFQPIAMLSNLGQTLQRASGALDRVTELLDEPAAIADRPAAVPLPPLEREIRLEHLTFGYSRDRPVLFDLSLAIPAGSRAAVVGPSGAGKTTIVNLLMRFWDPDQGRVLFDDHDLRDVTVASLRGQIGLVFQDTFVFDTTVRENIAMGRPGATDAEIAAAAEAAEIDAYISSLPAGYDAILGERGVRMSSGQRQRLAIARALLRDPRILLLDEATSALDARTEREILDTLAVLERGRTTIMVTHRLSLAATADRIFVLDKGRVVEHGSHADLVAAGGLYRRLHEEQTGYATDAAGGFRARPGPPRGPTA